MNSSGIKKGNLLRFSVSSRSRADIYEVIQDSDGMGLIDGYPADWFAGVPLTPATMRQSGFVEGPTKGAVAREGVIFTELPTVSDEEAHYVINVLYGDESTELYTLWYVHQLQNFYTEMLDGQIEILL